ncbi:aldose 1-epimerase [Azotobacter beijerinckii]|uniref:Aldose 1-epimerase n=1 Tax=Azotobacter beijerinckii TaxID=170623 RepID=A0A1H6YDA5_9GAMM|nr:aldose 1-epimerase [Azotobacter beijerinckii]SEJ39241.1 aldose 1-epimerase [Azotobacter beijerinckii]SER54604.1 aldose 1-epimerase [Azotobacter beijerinckii]
MITLQNESTRLELLPELGGGIASWVALDSGQPLLQSPVDNKHAPYSWGKLACFPLVPWSNRIEHSGYETAQGWLSLSCFQEGEPYPIHGTAWHQPWEVVSRSAEEAVLRLVSQAPYPYKAEQKFILAGERLILELTVEHMDHHPAWYGIGLHPFFPRWENTQLQAFAEAVWFEENRRLPRVESAIEGDWRFTDANRLPKTLIDHAFSGWDGRFLINQPDTGYQLECSATNSRFFVLYTPPGKDFFCFEPVSHPINAHHLEGRPGLQLLQCNQKIDMRMILTYRPL